MGTDSRFSEYAGSLDGFKFEDELAFPGSTPYSEFSDGIKFKNPSFDSDFDFLANPLILPQLDPGSSVESSTTSLDGDSPTDDNDFSATVLSYISQMLMEEDMEEKPCMFHDPLALQATEKSLYDVLGEKYLPPSPDQPLSYGDQFLVDSPDDGVSGNFSINSSISSSNTSGSVDHQWNGEFGEVKPSFMQMPLSANFVFQSTTKSNSHPTSTVQDMFASNGNGLGSSVHNFVVPNPFSESELALQFKRGVEEANKFLPKGNQLIVDLDTSIMTSGLKEKAPKVEVKIEKEEIDSLSNWLNVKKNREREDEEIQEERSNKQSAIYEDESELAEMFDKMLVCTCERRQHHKCKFEEPDGPSQTLLQNGQTNGSNGAKTRSKRPVNNNEAVDLRTILISCAQAVSADDHRTANELLKQIRQHSSPFGDGSQRLAHCFANALEARMAGTGTQIYTALSAAKTSAADMLKAYQGYISACPFNKLAIIFANRNILRVAEKATTLHIIDFGILYGFQWPALIYHLSEREGGPPKLRITGIELPQSGFRPADGVQETGRRLAKYCELRNVPFEYNGIAQKWETIRIDDLQIRSGETLAVNCLFRFKNLLDETLVINSPKNAVLNLIRKTNPDIFVHSVVNGSYNAPFFVTRFREALFHFSALFDILDTCTTREDQMRLKFEKEFFGREVMNVLACEGLERVERPETYKQWQIRNTRAGLKQLPLSPLAVKKLKCKVNSRYHEDFVVDEDGNWMLQGWKGRIICASSAWVAAQ